MALRPLQAGIQPLGQFDGLDTQYLLVKGGEVATFVGVPKGTDKATPDVELDGYVNNGTRTVVTTTIGATSAPLVLVDEGITGYGTAFGSVVGGVAGQVNGAVIGPHTATGSGKLTVWDKPGLYGVTLDAVDPDPATGLQPTNTTLTVGAPLYCTVDGLLTPDSGSAASATVVVGRFLGFDTNGSLVTTPAALLTENGAGKDTVTMATFHFNPVYG